MNMPISYLALAVDRIRKYIVTREEQFLYYKTDQERKEYQVLKY